MRDLRIVFMGTPDFAVPSLELLVKNDYQIVAVITSVDKPRGRGRQIVPSSVKQFATAAGIPVLQPVNLKDPDFVEELRSYGANLQVVVAFRMLPEVVWSMPEYGTFNLHASLLPQYRGAAPINWAIINGETKTGVTTFFIRQEIDTGNIILQEEEPISENDTAGTLHDRLMIKGSELVLKTVQLIEKGQEQPRKQEDIPVTKGAPKINKEMCEINWNRPVEEVRNFIRGLSPYPAAWTMIDDQIFRIFEVEAVEGGQSYLDPGSFFTDNKTHITFQASDGVLHIKELQAPGKKRMKTMEYLRGHSL